MGQFPMANWPIGFLAVHVLATSAQLGESHEATSLAPISWDRDAKRHLRGAEDSHLVFTDVPWSKHKKKGSGHPDLHQCQSINQSIN